MKEEKKEEEEKVEKEVKQEEKKKDANDIAFGKSRPTFQKASKGTNLKNEEFPDLDNVGKQEAPKSKKEQKAVANKDAPAVFERAAPPAEAPKEESKKDIQFGNSRPTFSKQSKKAEEPKTLAPVNKDNMDVAQRKMLELMEKDMAEKEKARQRAQERKDRIERGEEEERPQHQPREEQEPFRTEVRTEVRRGGGRGNRGGFRGGAQVQERNLPREAKIEEDEDFQMVTDKKKKPAFEPSQTKPREDDGGFIRRGQNKFGGFGDE